MKPALVVLLTGLACVTSVHAQATGCAGRDGIRPSYDACMKTTDGATAAMQYCTATEYTYQDQRLNKAYKALLAASTPSDRNTLVTDERIWIAFRKSHCAVDRNAGQAGEVDTYSCVLMETAKQAAFLENRGHINLHSPHA